MTLQAGAIRAGHIRWNNRSALRLENDRVQVTILAGGGHIAEFRIRSGDRTSPNLMWEAPWQTADPESEDIRRLGALYGGAPAGPFLAGYTGHILCLDTFGPPSREQAASGIPLHGEAPNRMWTVQATVDGCVGNVQLPHSGLAFTRTVRSACGQTVLLVEEALENIASTAREVHWIQHVSLGPPFLSASGCVIEASVDRCRTWPDGYEDRPLLPDNMDFAWPSAPAVGGGTVDLRIPFQRQGAGFVAAARVAQDVAIPWIVALNPHSGWALIYCLRRRDFPWIALWEENDARRSPPWNGTTRVRGMEFGTSPMPLGREAMQAMGRLFDTPVALRLPAGGRRKARYAIAAAPISENCCAVDSVTVSNSRITLNSRDAGSPVVIPADGIGKFLTEDDDPA